MLSIGYAAYTCRRCNEEVFVPQADLKFYWNTWKLSYWVRCRHIDHGDLDCDTAVNFDKKDF